MGKLLGRLGNQSKKRKTLNSNLLNSAKKIDLVSHPASAEELVNI